ncbi:hypothetical protein [Paucisalibacillus sp. EB02]|nr:hypothetical protein [Paucisalibacillus sp. EB02]
MILSYLPRKKVNVFIRSLVVWKSSAYFIEGKIRYGWQKGITNFSV